MVKVLIVDDEAMTRDLLRMMLAPVGFVVTEAQDGADALAQINSDPPDVVLLDVMMPNMDGIAVCKTLRANPTTVNLPVIMLSAKTHFNAVEDGLNAGANKYLSKPIGRKALISSINELLTENKDVIFDT